MDEEDDFIYIVMIVRVGGMETVGWRDFFFLKIVVAKMRK